MDGEVKVAVATTVQCTRGGTLQVRVAKRSVLMRVMDATQFRDGDTASEVRFVSLLCRASIVSAEGVKNAQGQEVRLKTVSHPTLKKIASEEFLDELTSEDIVAVTAATREESLPEAAQGN